jgi:predicted TIM-barrel fold metal-dependent hydrolase
LTIQLEEVGVDSEKITRPLPIVTSDSHMSPRGEDLKAYCPSRLRSAFEEWRRDEMQRRPYNTFQAHPGAKKRQELNAKTEGHFDIHARLRDMNADGVAAEVIFHGSQTPEPFPFGSTGAIDTRLEIADRNLALTGIQMYNRWLADACSVEPDRHVGLAYIPAWDIENTLSTMEWAKEAGLKGINFPAPRPYLAEYDNPVWDPVWAAAETMELPLVSHAGGIAPGVMDDGVHSDTPGNIALIGLEGGGWPSRRGLGRMLFAGVFERFPRLKMVYAEHPGLWWGPAMFEYDTQWHEVGPALQLVMPRKPSDYCRTNVFVGASFLSHFETEDAVHQN